MPTRYGFEKKILKEATCIRVSLQVSFFHTETRRTSHEFQGLVTSTLKPLESQCSKDDVFVNTFHQTRNYTDQWGNLNFIIRMKKLDTEEEEAAPMEAEPTPSTSTAPAPTTPAAAPTTEGTAPSSSVAATTATAVVTAAS